MRWGWLSNPWQKELPILPKTESFPIPVFSAISSVTDRAGRLTPTPGQKQRACCYCVTL